MNTLEPTNSLQIDRNDLDETTPDDSLSIGRLGMWVFISTEVMLFAGIIGVYLVLRFSALESGWPIPHLMHSEPSTGILNTIVLIFSAVTVWSSVKAAQADRSRMSKFWLVITVVLGCIFLLIKGYEYQSKTQVGLMPTTGEQQIYDMPDYQYLSAVDRKLQDRINRLERDSDRVASDEESARSQRLEQLYALKSYFTEWTVRVVAQIDDSYQESIAIRMMANQIYPHPDTAVGIEEFLTPEVKSLRRGIDETNYRIELASQRRAYVDRQVEKLVSEIDDIKLLNRESLQDNDMLSEKDRWLEVKKRQSKELQAEIVKLNNSLIPITGRITFLEQSSKMEDGINLGFDVRLPVVVANGAKWMSAYLLLTGAHAMHVVFGLLVFFWYLPRKLDRRLAPGLYVVGMYWQFVDVVWLTIFWLIYF